MSEFDWTELTVAMFYRTPMEKVYRAIATRRGMESFFISDMRVDGPKAPRKPDELFEKGDSYAWRWLVGKRLEGEIIEADAPHCMGFTFGEAKVRIELAEEDGGTLLTLTQYDMPDSESHRVYLHMNCRGGWIYHLTVLRGVLEHGIDVRDHNPATARSAAVDWRPGEHEEFAA